MNIVKTFKPQIFPIIGSVFACLYWFIDAAIDTFIFQSQRLYIEDLLRPDSIELLGRSQVVILMMALSLVAMFLLRKQQIITEQLDEYKSELENTVEDRTNDLRIKNIILEKEVADRMKIEEELILLAAIDPLTSIANRRKFNDELQSEISRNLRYHNDLSLIIFDLDNFKNINDEHGHNVGDDVLKEFTQLISNRIRNTDVFARWGGDEFSILLPETNLDTALQLSEDLRALTEKHYYLKIGHITASFGVTHFMKTDNEATFISRADEALYLSKENGRNQSKALPPKQSAQQLESNHCNQLYNERSQPVKQSWSPVYTKH